MQDTQAINVFNRWVANRPDLAVSNVYATFDPVTNTTSTMKTQKNQSDTPRNEVKEAYITPPTDFFCICPYCGNEHTTNIDSEKIVCESCGYFYVAVYDRDYFMAIVEHNIHEVNNVKKK